MTANELALESDPRHSEIHTYVILNGIAPQFPDIDVRLQQAKNTVHSFMACEELVARSGIDSDSGREASEKYARYTDWLLDCVEQADVFTINGAQETKLGEIALAKARSLGNFVDIGNVDEAVVGGFNLVRVVGDAAVLQALLYDKNNEPAFVTCEDRRFARALAVNYYDRGVSTISFDDYIDEVRALAALSEQDLEIVKKIAERRGY